MGRNNGWNECLMTNVRRLNGFTIVIIMLTVISCDSRPKVNPPQPVIDDRSFLEKTLVYNDSIGDVTESIEMMERRMDSLYTEIEVDIESAYAPNDDLRYLQKWISKAKGSYKVPIEANSVLYAEVYGPGTGAGAAGALYYYYGLTKYYEDVAALQIELRSYFESLKADGLDTVISMYGKNKR